MTLPYRVLINIAVDEGGRPLKHLRFRGSPYQPGDLMVQTWAGAVDGPDAFDPVTDPEVIWRLHNADDRPDGQIGPSFSMGDVVVFDTGAGSRAFAAETFGFSEVEVPTNLYSGTWLEFQEGLRKGKTPSAESGVK